MTAGGPGADRAPVVFGRYEVRYQIDDTAAWVVYELTRDGGRRAMVICPLQSDALRVAVALDAYERGGGAR